LIVDDAPLFARALAAELDRCGGLHALCSGSEMAELRAQLIRFHPEVILLDLGLRNQESLELLRKLRAHYPVPVIVAAEPTGDSADRALRAVRGGALEVFRKPALNQPGAVRALAEDLADKIRATVAMARPVPPPVSSDERPTAFRAPGLDPARHLVAIGASTGGTSAIETLLRRVPPDFPPTVIVQHIPAGFSHTFAARLNSRSCLSVSEAVDGECLGPGRAVVARGDTHLVVQPEGGGWSVHYTYRRPVNRHCPSVDVLFDSIAAVAGAQAIGVLLTGMGADGARGLLAIRQAGGVTIAQSGESCVVFGMPRAAIDLEAAQYTAAPEDIPALVRQVLQERTPRVQLTMPAEKPRRRAAQ
jgi:two-component system chemotaxis response regulator CheB